MQQRRSASWGWFTAGLATVLVVGTSLVPLPTAKAASVVFEAEAETNVRTGQARVLDRPEASGAKAIGYVGGGNGRISWVVCTLQMANPEPTRARR